MISDLKFTTSSPLITRNVLPQKILMSTPGVTNPQNILENNISQPTTGDCEITLFSTLNGNTAAVLLDLGSEINGGVQITARKGNIREGLHMKLRFGESVAEAMASLSVKGACNDHSVRDMDIILPWNSSSIFGRTGYRFLYLELTESNSYIEIISIHGTFSYRDIPYIGSFKCDDPLINKIYDTCAYTVHLNMQNMLLDGIKRDRLVWIGDMYPEILAIRSIFGYNSIVDECLNTIPKTFPLPNWPNNMTTYGMWYILILWDWFLQNGKIDLIENLCNYWKPLLLQLISLIHENSSELLNENEFNRGYFLDWPTNGTAAKAGIYALLVLTLEAGSHLCNAVKDPSTADLCISKSKLLKRCCLSHNNKKQIIALMHMSDMPVDGNTAELLTNDGGHGMSTFMSYFILKAAADTSGIEKALQMLREYYGGMLKAGATTFWEDFDLDWLKEGASIDRVLEKDEYDIHGDNGRFCYCGFRHSLCHGWSAGPAAFLSESILGIKIIEPGCKKILISPHTGNLAWAKGTYPTPYGAIEISIKSGKYINISAPKEIEILKSKNNIIISRVVK